MTAPLILECSLSKRLSRCVTMYPVQEGLRLPAAAASNLAVDAYDHKQHVFSVRSPGRNSRRKWKMQSNNEPVKSLTFRTTCVFAPLLLVAFMPAAQCAAAENEGSVARMTPAERGY